MTTFALISPRAPDTNQDSGFTVQFTPTAEGVDIVDWVLGGIGGTFTVDKARKYYKDKLEQGYTKV